MAIKMSDLRVYGSATMPDDDTTEQIGGAIATSKKPIFTDFSGAMQVLSSETGDTSQSVTVYYRDSAGSPQSEAKTLQGQTPVAYSASPERLLKATKGVTCVGDVVLEASTAERTGTCQGGSADTITLDAGASGTDGAYNGMMIRITSGTGAGQIREVIDYVGASKLATVGRAWGTNPVGADSVFRIAKGIVFDKSPAEITEVRRIGYAMGANSAGGATKEVHEKIFLKNCHGTIALTSAQVEESSDPSGLFTFGLATSVNDSGTNGSGNTRLVAPAGITFDNSAKNVPGGSLAASSAIGCWIKATLPGGTAAAKTTYLPQLKGNTID